MYRRNRNSFLSVIIQGALFENQTFVEILRKLAFGFEQKSFPVCGFGPTRYQQNGFLWGNGCSAECEIRYLVNELFYGSTWIHPWEILLVTDQSDITSHALGLEIEIGGVLFLGNDTPIFPTERQDAVIYFPNAVENILADIPTLAEV